MDHSKRYFIGLNRNVTKSGFAPVRPPWAQAESRFTQLCTSCGQCIEACPESILVRGDGNFPSVDFSQNACTFCEECATHCPTDALMLSTLPWSHYANISDNCLAIKGIACQVCQDSCENRAISFVPRIGAPSQPRIDNDQCTGCGACISACIGQAISLTQINDGETE